jgi:hypothetical protein
MNFIQNREEDEDTHAWPTCDKCGEPSDTLEPVGECELAADWCFECIRTEVGRMVEEQQRDDEMRSLKGYYSGELDRI